MSTLLSSAPFLKKIGFNTKYIYEAFEKEYEEKAEELAIALQPMEFKTIRFARSLLKEMQTEIKDVEAKERAYKMVEKNLKRKLAEEEKINDAKRLKIISETEEDDWIRKNEEVLKNMSKEKRMFLLGKLTRRIISQHEMDMYTDGLRRLFEDGDEE